MYDLRGTGRNRGGHGKLPAVGEGHSIKRHAIFVKWGKVAIGVRHSSPNGRHVVDFYDVAGGDTTRGNHRLIESINGFDDFSVDRIARMGNASALIEGDAQRGAFRNTQIDFRGGFFNRLGASIIFIFG